MNRTVAAKMGIRENSRAYFADADDKAVGATSLPALDVKLRLTGEFDYIHLFARNKKDMAKQFPKLKKHLAPGGMLWVSWPKAKQLGTDLTIKEVIRIGYDFGMVESTAVSVDDIWSALKFTHPKEGKEYHNSYGALPKADGA